MHSNRISLLGLRRFGIVCLLSVAGGVATAQPCGTVIEIDTWGLTSEARGVSSDGNTVIGWLANPSGKKWFFRWEASTGVTLLVEAPGIYDAFATDISGDASTIVGWHLGWQAYSFDFGWNAASGFQILSGVQSSAASAISSDGSVVVGNKPGSGYRWSASGGLEALKLGTYAVPKGVSSDGNVVVGLWNGSETGGKEHMFRWSTETGMQSLGVVPGFTNTHAMRVSDDGLAVSGQAWTNVGSVQAFHWTSKNGYALIDNLGGMSSFVSDMTPDGEVVVGVLYDSGSSWRAFRWSSQAGTHDLGTGTGVNSYATGVSDDGRVVVGYTTIASGKTAAFMWKACDDPPLCYPDCDQSGSLDIDDFICYQSRYAIGDPAADCDGDGALSIDDFICFQTFFAIGC